MTAGDVRSALAERWSLLVAVLYRCGLATAVAVVGGSLAAGTLVWHGATRALPAPAATAGLPFALVVAAAAGVGAWLYGASLAARRYALDPIDAFRSAALPYAGMLAYPVLALAMPHARGTVTAGTLAATAAGAAIGVARFAPAWRTALWTFAIAKLPIVAIAELGPAVLPLGGAHHPAVSRHPLLEVFARWDGARYLAIARHGYHGDSLAFFPLYPLAIRLAGAVVGDDLAAALLISNAAFLAALLLLHQLVAEQFDEATADRAILYLAIFPTAVFFASAYSESLFLALALGMFAALKRERWLLAGMCGGLAALTRVEGVLLAVCYVVEIFAPERDLWSALRVSVPLRKHLAIGLGMIPAGLGAFMVLSWLLGGDPLAFTHVQSHWRRSFAPPWASVANSVRRIATSPNAATVAVQSTELAATILIAATIVYGLRRIRPSYSAYAALSLAVPLATSSLMSTPRFALTIFPAFVVLAVWGRRPAVHAAIMTCAPPFAGVFTLLYACWYWVA